MSRSGITVVIPPILFSAFGQNTASAQVANHHRPYQSVRYSRVDVPSGLRRPYRGRLFDVYGEASSPLMRPWHQRTVNETSFITEDRNLEGYPRPRD
jgi:hypothetical protein